MKTNFNEDIIKGRIGECIFMNDFLNFLNIKSMDVSNESSYQRIDSDFDTTSGLYEIKMNYKDNGLLCFEEFTNVNKDLGEISKGWMYKSKAKFIVFVSKDSHTMLILNFNDDFKKFYETIKDNYKLNHNKITVHENKSWQGAYRWIPVKIIKQYLSIYKKL